MKNLVLIDGNSMANRAFYATNQRAFYSPDKTPTNAVYGFLQILFKIIEEENPSYLGVAFDLKGSTKRSELYSEYKANRSSMPEDLAIQMPMIKEILELMNIPIFQKQGIEADDIVGTIAKKVVKENKDIKAVLLTGDRDYFQLVEENIVIRYPKLINKKTEYVVYDIAKINEEYELNPSSLIEVKALMGDTSDNIPGVKGIGEKTAIKLIKEFENIENLYINLEEYIENSKNDKNLKISITKGNIEKLINDKENAFISKILGTIDINVELENLKTNDNLTEFLKDLKYTTWKNSQVAIKLIKLNMKSIVEKFNLKELVNFEEEFEKENDNQTTSLFDMISTLNEEENTNNNLDLTKIEEFKSYITNTGYDFIDEEMIIKYIENITNLKIYSKAELNNNILKKQEYINYIINNYEIKNNIVEELETEKTNLKEILDNSIYISFNTNKLESSSSYLNYTEEEKEILDSLNSNQTNNSLNFLSYYQNSISKEIVNSVNIAFKYKKKDRSKENTENKVENENEFISITLDLNDAKEILENSNIYKVGSGLKNSIVSLKENNINLSSNILDLEVVYYLLESNSSKYNLESNAINNFKIDTTKLQKIANDNEKIYSVYSKEINKILSSIKKLIKSNDKKEILKNINNLNDLNYLNNINNTLDKKILDKLIELKTDYINLDEKLKTDLNLINENKIYTSMLIYIFSNKLVEKLIESKMDKLYLTIENPLIEVLASMQYDGIYINLEKLEEFGKNLKEKIINLEKEIYEIAGYEFNISSTQQLGKLLFEDLKLPVVRKTKTGYSTDVEVLKKLEKENEIITLILEYRELTKLNSTYVDGLKNNINLKTNKIHSSFNQTVAATGRISSTEPNMQNIPIRKELGQEIRNFFETSKDILIDSDYSQIELRILADMSGDEAMIDAFNNNLDIHTSTASTIFNIPIDEVTKEYRSYAKAVNFGIVYGISDYGLSEGVNISIKEAGEYIKKYLEKYENVDKFMKVVVENAKENEYVTTIFGRRRYVENINSKNFLIREAAKRIAMNAPIQGTAADIMKLAMIKVYNKLKGNKLKSKLILQVHDEILVDTVKEEEEQVLSIIKDCMENVIDLKVKLEIDINKGKTWNDAK